MGRLKGSVKKADEGSEKAVHGTEKPQADIAPAPAKETPKTPNVAKHRICLYHKTDGPRVFEKDEIIPEGWQDEPYDTIGGEEK